MVKRKVKMIDSESCTCLHFDERLCSFKQASESYATCWGSFLVFNLVGFTKALNSRFVGEAGVPLENV